MDDLCLLFCIHISFFYDFYRRIRINAFNAASPYQQRLPLPFLLSNFYSMIIIPLKRRYPTVVITRVDVCPWKPEAATTPGVLAAVLGNIVGVECIRYIVHNTTDRVLSSFSDFLGQTWPLCINDDMSGTFSSIIIHILWMSLCMEISKNLVTVTTFPGDRNPGSLHTSICFPHSDKLLQILNLVYYKKYYYF